MGARLLRGALSPRGSQALPEGSQPDAVVPDDFAKKRVFDVTDWEGGIHWVPRTDNQDDSPAFEVWWTVFHKR